MGIKLDKIIFIGLLNVCVSLEVLIEGRRFYVLIIEVVFDCDVFVGIGLISMYIKCGSIEDVY